MTSPGVNFNGVIMDYMFEKLSTNKSKLNQTNQQGQAKEFVMDFGLWFVVLGILLLT